MAAGGKGLTLFMAAESVKNGLFMNFYIGTSGADSFLEATCLDFIARQRRGSPFWMVKIQLTMRLFRIP